MAYEFKKMFDAIEQLPKEEDYKRALKEAHEEYGTLKKGNIKKQSVLRKVLNCKSD